MKWYQDMFAGFAVNDLPAAKSFYAGTLNIAITEDTTRNLLMLRLPNNSEVLIYPKPGHVPANYTVLNFVVKDIDQAVDSLIAKGVTFEQYEGFGQDEKGIKHPEKIEDGPKSAWFKDPAGNILGILQENT